MTIRRVRGQSGQPPPEGASRPRDLRQTLQPVLEKQFGRGSWVKAAVGDAAWISLPHHQTRLQPTWIWNDPHEAARALTCGDVAFTDRLLHPAPIQIEGFATSLFGRATTLRYATLSCGIALSELGVKGASVFDIGCGTGELLLWAARTGALFVMGVDHEKPLTAARHSLVLNGLSEKKDFTLSAIDVRDVERLIGVVPPQSQEIVIVSNIGDWPSQYPGTSNIQSLQMIERLQAQGAPIRGLVLGGYNLPGGSNPNADLAYAERLGLSKLPGFAAMGDFRAYAFRGPRA